MEQIPDYLPPLIAGYLPPLDAINFSHTARKLQSQLSFTVARHRILRSFNRHDRNADRHYGFQIPIASHVAVHSILVSMDWKDQGWGNRKGRVFVVGEEKDRAHDRSVQGQSLFGGGRVIFSSGIAPHILEHLSFTFKARENESYHLWYVVGGGGGHSLRLTNVSVQALVLDDRAHSFGKAHAFLAKSNAFHPWHVAGSPQDHQFRRDTLNAILASTSHALTHGLQIPPPIVSFFDSYGVSGTDLSVELINSIESVQNDWEQVMSNCRQIGRDDSMSSASDDDGDYFFLAPGEQLQQHRGGDEDGVPRQHHIRFSLRETFGRR